MMAARNVGPPSLWPAAERAQVPVALGAAMFLPTVGRIAERHPGLKLIVDHMGVPRASKGEAACRFQPELRTWRQCVTLFTEELPWLKGRDLDLVMGEALCNWVGWPLPGAAKS